jgi:hypothetical protein
MIWKELYTNRARGLARLVSFLLTVVGGGFLAYWTVWYAVNAIVEVWRAERWSPWGYTTQPDRWVFCWFLVSVVPLIYLLGILVVPSAAATSITSEHEGDTWVSLTVTDLTGREIIFAKPLEALKRGRGFAGLILLLAAIGVVTGSVHLFSLPLLVIALAVYGWFAASLGVWISLQLRSTWRAQFLTIATLLLVNVTGQGLLNALSRFGYPVQLWPGFSPYEITRMLPDPEFFRRLSTAFSTPWRRAWWALDIDDSLPWQVTFTVLSVLSYTLLATLLTWLALRQFEFVTGRAQRVNDTTPSEKVAGKRHLAIPGPGNLALQVACAELESDALSGTAKTPKLSKLLKS